jgi:hypothetical protein
MTATDRLIDKRILEMKEAGLTYDEMLKVFKIARVKLEKLRDEKNN